MDQKVAKYLNYFIKKFCCRDLSKLPNLVTLDATTPPTNEILKRD